MQTINTELLIQLMNQTGLTYSEISRLSNISRNTIYNVILGKNCPTTAVITSLAKSLEMSEAVFIEIFFPSLQFKK